MKKLILLLCCSSIPFLFFAQKNYQTPFEMKENTSTTYDETIAFYKQLADEFSELEIKEVGTTDVGRPLHLVVLASQGDFTPQRTRANGKAILFINNAIHPGEPCGVDASMLLVRDYLTNPELKKRLEYLTIAIIPFYNIGGGLNRNSTTRVNQNGPEAYGFRGNAQHLDLNRDFIKCDSKNARTFNQVYTQWMPDVFVDTHTSNGADYQYTMTLIATQHSKMDSNLAGFMQQKMLPYLYRHMEQANWEMIPYVNARSTPDEGIAGFLDLARYSSGYAALHNAISFMPETHMLKPFKDRVQSTYAFLDGMIQFLDKNYEELLTTRKQTTQRIRSQTQFPINWSMDTNRFDSITFKGYEAKYKKSAITGADRLYYDQNAPFEKAIPYYNYYSVKESVNAPIAYVLPQAAHRVVDRLKWNNVKMERLAEDVEMEVEIYYIKDYETTTQPYEGHYLHYNVEVKKRTENTTFRKGDYVIYVNQPINRYIVETLEPHAPDAFFAWNFFDGFLQRKEYFSAYVFEDLAVEILKNNPTIQRDLEEKRKSDQSFANNSRQQLQFIYERSEHAEKEMNRYPVGRLVRFLDLKLE